MGAKQVHYNIDNIDKENANYNLIYGEKSNGKSYQVKHKKALNPYIENKRRFILQRRFREDLTKTWVSQYFADCDIERITNGVYNSVTKYSNEIYFSKINEDFKEKRGEKIGYAIPLSLEQRFSSGSFLDVDNIIFEEFMSRGIYLANEPNKLMTFYSTVDRKQGRVKLWLVGNTVSKICPYLNDWGLITIMKKQKQGEIKTKIIHNEENDVKIAIEYCKSSGGKTMAIGSAKQMIDSGEWQVDKQPILPLSYKEYKMLFRIGFLYKGFKFLGELLKNNITNEICWFIYPYYKEFSENMLVFSDVVCLNQLWQKDIYKITLNNSKIQNILNTFRESMIFYASDMTGTDFKQAIDFIIRK